MACEKLSLWFHLKSDWMNLSDEDETVFGSQSFYSVAKYSPKGLLFVPYGKYMDFSFLYEPHFIRSAL